MLVVNDTGAGPEMIVLGPDVLSVSAGHRYPWILQSMGARHSHDCLRLGEERMLLPFFILGLQAAPQYK